MRTTRVQDLCEMCYDVEPDLGEDQVPSRRSGGGPFQYLAPYEDQTIRESSAITIWKAEGSRLQAVENKVGVGGGGAAAPAAPAALGAPYFDGKDV